MREHLSVVTRKGQITIPAPVRKALGLQRGDKVSVALGEGEARFVRAGSVVMRTAGAFKSYKRPLSAESLREEAETAIAREAVDRG